MADSKRIEAMRSLGFEAIQQRVLEKLSLHGSLAATAAVAMFYKYRPATALFRHYCLGLLRRLDARNAFNYADVRKLAESTGVPIVLVEQGRMRVFCPTAAAAATDQAVTVLCCRSEGGGGGSSSSKLFPLVAKGDVESFSDAVMQMCCEDPPAAAAELSVSSQVITTTTTFFSSTTTTASSVEKAAAVPALAMSQPVRLKPGEELMLYYSSKIEDYYGTNHFALMTEASSAKIHVFFKYITAKLARLNKSGDPESKRLIEGLFDLCFRPGLPAGEVAATDLDAKYAILRDSAVKLGLIPTEEDETRKAKELADTLYAAVAHPEAITSYIDIGCGDGTKTGAFVRRFGLNRKVAIGLEYEEPSSAAVAQQQEVTTSMGTIRSGSEFSFCWYPGSEMCLRVMPAAAAAEGDCGADASANSDLLEPNGTSKRFPWRVKDASVKLITCNHVLHHVHPEDRLVLLREVFRVLAPGGTLIVKEHDSPNTAFGHFLDAVHIFKQRITFERERESMPFSSYQSASEWISQISGCGLVLKRQDPEPNSHTSDILLCFEKN